jgi:hypothetical protein
VSEWRYIAQAIPSGEFLEWELPLDDVEITRVLSGPGRLTATIPAALPRLADVLRPFGTAIWAEASGTIRGGGILTPWSVEDQRLQLDCMGIAGIPAGQPWTANQKTYVQRDPLDVVRDIWAHLQAQPDGNMGVVVDSTKSLARVGNPATKVNGKVTPAEPLSLDWWSTHDLGRVIDDLAEQAPFDYLEHTAWSGERLAHRIRLGYPTIGQRKTGPTAPRFALGENVVLVPQLSAEDDDYASDILSLGAGEGRAMKRGPVVRRPGRGLRRVAVVIDKNATTSEQLGSLARQRLGVLDGQPRLHTLTVVDHPHARIGTFAEGDEIYVSGASGWTVLDRWVRIVEYAIRPDQGDRVTITVQEV